MILQENIPLGPKTTMKIGGTARWYAELQTKADVEEAWKTAREKNVPLVILGGGANTVFEEGTIEALVVKIAADDMAVEGNAATARTGCILATLLNGCAKRGLDLSPLAGIPGTLGGAIVGNAGQGPGGVWLDSFLESVTVYDGRWKTLSKADCHFSYRESIFKHWPADPALPTDGHCPILWEATLRAPPRPEADVQANITALLRKKIETQPQRLTAGSCFKAVGGTPAWQLIDGAKMKGFIVGGVQISEKHANFLINTGTGTFKDVMGLITAVRAKVPALQDIEMRLIGKEGRVVLS